MKNSVPFISISFLLATLSQAQQLTPEPGQTVTTVTTVTTSPAIPVAPAVAVAPAIPVAPAVAVVPMQTVTIGSASNGSVTCTITASEPLDGHGDVTLLMVEKVASGQTASRTAVIKSGKSLTIGKVVAMLRSSFATALTNIAPGTSLGRIGDVKYGGEVHFVTAPRSGLNFQYLFPEGRQDSIEFALPSVTLFHSILSPATTR